MQRELPQAVEMRSLGSGIRALRIRVRETAKCGGWRQIRGAWFCFGGPRAVDSTLDPPVGGLLAVALEGNVGDGERKSPAAVGQARRREWDAHGKLSRVHADGSRARR